MYLPKSAQHQSGEYVEEEGNLYEGIFAFMVVGLKQSIVQTISGVTFNGLWLTEKISDNIDNLIEIELRV